MIDVSAFVGAWPFRHLPDAESPEVLQKRLEQWGITQAYVSPFEALLHLDPMPANAFWASRLARSAFFRFVPVLNPSLPIPADRLLADARTLTENGEISAIRLYPNYHGYALESDAVRTLTQKAGEQNIVVIVQTQMQDIRGMNPLVRVTDTDPNTVLELAQACPELTVVAAGVRWAAANALAKKAAAEPKHRLYLETSHFEFVDPIRQFVDSFGAERLLAGSHAPLLTPASLKIKLEAARLTPGELEAITTANAGKAGFR